MEKRKGPKPKTITQRFWPKVTKTTGCWLWTGCLDRKGYGKIGSGGYRSKTLSSHRVSWMINIGPISRGLHVLHKCDNPKCVNPEHLFLGTHADNVRDMVKKGRNNRPQAARTIAKITEEDVYVIRKLAKSGENRKRLAKKYGLDLSSIYSIINRRTWKHL